MTPPCDEPSNRIGTRRCGFSLIELVVVIVLGSLLGSF